MKKLFVIISMICLFPFYSWSQDSWKHYKSRFDDPNMCDTLFNIKKIIPTKQQTYVGTSFGLGIIRNDSVLWYNWNNTNIKNKNSWAFVDICIDKSNNIWAATNYGIMKYNGSEFKLLTSANSSLKTNWFTSIICDDNNNIWCTDNGKFLYKIQDTTIQVFDLLKLNLPLPFIQGCFLQTDAQGKIWYSSGRLLVNYDGTNWNISDSTYVPFDNSDINDGDVITGLLITKDNSIIVKTKKAAILFNHKGTWYQYTHENITDIPQYDKNNNYMFGVSEDKQSNILIGIAGIYQKEKAKLLILDKDIADNFSWHSIILPSISHTSPNDSNNYAPASIVVDDDNKLWLGTNTSGVLVLENYITQVEETKQTNDLSNIIIYPNPASDYITIQPSEGLKPAEGSDIQIFDMLGEIVLTVEQTSPSVQRIDVSNLFPGMYFIKIGNRLEKFMKM